MSRKGRERRKKLWRVLSDNHINHLHPTRVELATLLGCGHSTLESDLHRLRDLGYITLYPHVSYGIRVKILYGDIRLP